jgi:hypothetical protein
MLCATVISARLGALCYISWGAFHVEVARDIYLLGARRSSGRV